jgi:hypothetical protein
LGQNQPAQRRKKTNNAEPESAWPSNITDGGGGNYFPSPFPACRTLFILHARKKKQQNTNNEGEEELPGAEEVVRCWSGCFAGGAAVEAGGGVVAHGWRLQTVTLLFQTVEKEAPALPFSSSSSAAFPFSFVMI